MHLDLFLRQVLKRQSLAVTCKDSSDSNILYFGGGIPLSGRDPGMENHQRGSFLKRVQPRKHFCLLLSYSSSSAPAESSSRGSKIDMAEDVGRE